jgi:hypothetical protein
VRFFFVNLFSNKHFYREKICVKKPHVRKINFYLFFFIIFFFWSQGSKKCV